MKFDMVRPCGNCPFVVGQSFLHKARAREIIRSITVLDQQFPCHKTIDHDEDGDGVIRRNSQHCAGAMIFLEQTGRANQMMRIAERLHLYDRDKLDMDSDVYPDAKAMVKGHGR